MGTVKTNKTTFQFSVDFFDDDRIKNVSHEYPCFGESLLIRIICEIQKNGGKLIWDQNANLKFCLSSKLNISTELIDEFINKCLEFGIFNYDEFINSSMLVFIDQN